MVESRDFFIPLAPSEGKAVANMFAIFLQPSQITGLSGGVHRFSVYLFTHSLTRVTDRQTDRQTDTQTRQRDRRVCHLNSGSFTT